MKRNFFQDELQDDDDNPARKFSRMQQWYIPLHAYERKVRSLLTINQRVILAEDERIQKEGKEKECFPVSCQLMTITIWQQLVKNNNQMYLFPWERRVGTVR